MQIELEEKEVDVLQKILPQLTFQIKVGDPTTYDFPKAIESILEKLKSKEK